MKTLHFELSPRIAKENVALTLHLNNHTFELQPHTPQTLLQAAQTNSAIALIPEENRFRLTHFVKIPMEHLADDRLTFIQVTSPDDDPEIYLPKLYHMSFYVPRAHRQRRLQKLAAKRQGIHPKLLSFCVTAQHLQSVGSFDLEDSYLAAEDVLTPWDIAKSLLFYHPELATNKPQTAAVIMDDHIAPSPDLNPEQYNKVYNLALAISKQGEATSKGGWAMITDSVDQYGKPLYYQYDLGTHKTGDRVLMYKLSDETSQAAAAPVTGAMRTANDDPRLKDQVWSVNQGITADQKDGKTLLQSAMRVKGTSPDIWRVNEKTPSHGLSVYNDSIKFNSDNTFSINVKNTYLRTLCAYAQFFTENGDAIKNPEGWKENLPSFLSFLETDSKKYISTVSAVNTIMGIPMPTDPTTLSFVFPKDATVLKLMFGCLGTSRWDSDVDVSGALMTGFFQYGVPSLFLAAGAAVTSTKFFNDFVKDIDNVVALLGVAFPIVGGGVATASAIWNTKKVLFMFADAVAGIIVQKGLEKLALYITSTLTVQELETQVPYVGWALRLANMAIDFAEMAVTTGEILSSPATLEVEVKRVMDLHLTLKPDPKHGEIGHPETAVWPAVSDHYHVTVQYQGGTNFVLQGAMPDVTSSQPLDLTFKELPIGGKIKIIAGIYSENGWLCGKWESDWFDAFPDKDSTVKTVTANIEEQLVPLTQDSQYLYKEKVIYNAANSKHIWNAEKEKRPLATIADLHCDVGFKTICKPVNMTINSGAFQVGYSWRSAGAKFVCQNISVLADPESRYKFSEVGFDVQPYIAYDEFGTKAASQGSPEAISPDNFILDTRNGQFHLRQVNLEDGKSGFGLNDPDLKSWGKFNMSNMDAIVYHPNRVVIGVSWNNNKMEILQLPEKPVADQDAPDAQMVSGMGVRQGLMKGPKLIAVTPDGRILILETLNRRIQSFDTKGNPVASFMGERLFTLNAAQYAPDLDAGIFSDALQQEFQNHGLTHIFDLSATLQADLDKANLSDAIINEFADEGIFLTYDKDHRNDPNLSSYITVNQIGSSWTVTDPNKKVVYSVGKNGADLQVFDVLTNVTVDVRSVGKNWVVQDWNGAQSYYIAVDDNDLSTLNLNRYLPYMALYNPEGRTDIEYLDMAIEARGYVYVLSYTRPGNQVSDYRMDIYQPDGTFLVRTPDSRLQPDNPQYISAARMVVDIWRNVYTMNFEALEGPNGIIEPSISHWIPTPPLFDLGLEAQDAFVNGDMKAITAYFAPYVTLSSSATVKTVGPNGYWEVDDTTNHYDVIRSGEKLEVYLIPRKA